MVVGILETPRATLAMLEHYVNHATFIIKEGEEHIHYQQLTNVVHVVAQLELIH